MQRGKPAYEILDIIPKQIFATFRLLLLCAIWPTEVNGISQPISDQVTKYQNLPWFFYRNLLSTIT